MRIFSQLFRAKKVEKKSKQTMVNWKELKTIEQLNKIIEESKTRPIAIFKHSVRCAVSGMVIRQFESNYNLEQEQMSVYYLDLLVNREVSDEIAARFQVWHQSPQLIIIKDGFAVHHASHHGILGVRLNMLV